MSLEVVLLALVILALPAGLVLAGLTLARVVKVFAAQAELQQELARLGRRDVLGNWAPWRNEDRALLLLREMEPGEERERLAGFLDRYVRHSLIQSGFWLVYLGAYAAFGMPRSPLWVGLAGAVLVLTLWRGLRVYRLWDRRRRVLEA